MKAKSRYAALATLVAVVASSAALAQSPASGGTVQVIPIVASTGSYSTEAYVRNQNDIPLTVDVKFYEALTSAQPGLKPCAQISLAAQETKPFTLSSQCTLGPNNHHGMLILEDASAEKINRIGVYSRSQTPGGNGFSVPSYVPGGFSGQAASVLGIKRVAAAPIYQTNCFVAALGDAVDYQITLYDGPANTQIGNIVTGSLQPYEMRRYLDIFTVAAAPAGDYTNVRVDFRKDAVTPSPIVGSPAIVAFCTVQESTFFGADFRIAKSREADNLRERRLLCYGQSACGTIDNSTAIPNATTKNIHYIIIAQPDYVKCELVGPRIGELEIQLRGPGGATLGTQVWPSSAPYTSGGDNQTFFYMYTGLRSTINGGYTQQWFIDIGPREGLPGGTVFPIPYGITCQSGNGITFPWFRGSTTDNF